MTPATISVESWQLIDGQRSADGMTYTAVYWCEYTGAIKTERTSDGRFRMGEGPRIRKPALLQQLAEKEAEVESTLACNRGLVRLNEAVTARAESAERAREEATGLLKRCETALRVGECDMSYHDEQGVRRSLQQTIAAFLAASGGDRG